MSPKPVVNVKPNKLSSGFTEAIEFCRELSRNTGDSDLDMSEVRFVSPSFLLPAMVYLQNLPYWPNMTNIGTYLSVVSFQRRRRFVPFFKELGIQILYGVICIEKFHTDY